MYCDERATYRSLQVTHPARRAPTRSCTTAKQGDHEDVNRASQLTSRPRHVRERLIGALIPDALGTRTESPSVPLPALPTLSRLNDLNQAALLVSATRRLCGSNAARLLCSPQLYPNR